MIVNDNMSAYKWKWDLYITLNHGTKGAIGHDPSSEVIYSPSGFAMDFGLYPRVTKREV